VAIRLVKLHEELIAAGIPVEGVSADGRALADGVFERVRVDLKAGATTAQRAQAEAILAAHDPRDGAAEQQARALTYLENVNFAARRAVIDGSTLAASTKTLLKTINRTEWALAVLVLGLVADDPGE